MELLDLPAEVFHLILSLLCPLTLAALRLVCKTLREVATPGRRLVTIHFDGCYSATATASERVLRLMHAYQSLLTRLDAEEAEEVADTADALVRSKYRKIRRFLQAQLLGDVAQEVVALSLWSAQQAGKPETQEGQLENPNSLLAKLVNLESLTMETGLDRAVIHELPALQQLKRLLLCKDERFRSVPPGEDIQLICSSLSLTQLDLPISLGGTKHPRQVLGLLATGKTSGLHNLALTLLERDVCALSKLSTLTSLSALHVKVRMPWSDRSPDLKGLAHMTGLKSLRLETSREGGMGSYRAPIADTLAPLSLLTGLTLLDLMEHAPRYFLDHCEMPSNLAVLSALTALRVLRCCLFDRAEFVEGDPIPVQLHFLRTTTALEELELGFGGGYNDSSDDYGWFWPLPDDSSSAMRAAVCALPSLKRVKTWMTFRDGVDNASLCAGSNYRKRFANAGEYYYAPLAVFAAAATIETLSHMADIPVLLRTPQTIATARACLTALTKLQSLVLCGMYVDRHKGVPDCVDLLAGLPSNRLTHLCLRVDTATERFMDRLAQFRDLQDLTLYCNTGVSRFLDPLFNLRCLTRLHMSWDSDAMRELHGGAFTAIEAEATSLKKAIVDASKLVGHVADVNIIGRVAQAGR